MPCTLILADSAGLLLHLANEIRLHCDFDETAVVQVCCAMEGLMHMALARAKDLWRADVRSSVLLRWFAGRLGTSYCCTAHPRA